MDARGKFGEHERSVRVARGAAESNSSFLSALQTSQVHPFNNYRAKSRGISSDRRYSVRLSRIIVLLFNKLITKLVTFLNLSVHIFSLHFFFQRTKLRISPDICYLRMTDIESIMTMFG